MTKKEYQKTNKNIYFPERGILLNRKTAYITCISDDKKEEKEVNIDKTKVTFFGKKIKYTEKVFQLRTKYWFRLGDEKWSVNFSNFDYDELLILWKEFSEEINN